MSPDRAAGETSDAPACPYVGARAFEESDREGYVGREHEIELVVNKVLAGRVTVLFGPSGVGKSSLLRAGLIPRMREVCEGGVFLIYRDVWIEGNYLTQLQTSVSDYARISREVGPDDAMPVLLIVLDGFEQLLARSTPDEARALIEYLTELVHSSLDLRIAISLRAEFLARFDAYRNELPELMQGRFPLRPLRRAQVRRALIEPAQARDVEWDPAFVDRLIADFDAAERSDELGETGPQLCFLSEVARRLWNRMESHGRTRIEAELYQGRDDELNGILCEVFADLDEPTLDAAARIACRLAPPTGRKVPCTITDLTSDPGVSEASAQTVLARLQNHHLVRLRESGAARWFELTHDTLTGFLRRWGDQRLTTIRDRAAMLERAATRRAKRRKLVTRGVALCLMAGVLGGFVWYTTMGMRVASETREHLEKLNAGITPEMSGAQRATLHQQRVEQYAQELWSRWHKERERERWVLHWLEAAHKRAPDAFAQARQERSRQVGEPANCELLAGDEKSIRFLDFAWRTASPVLRRWHVPVTERVPACRVDYLERGTVALSADASAARAAPSRRIRSASHLETGPSGDNRATAGVSEPVTLLQSVKPKMSWESVRVKDYEEQFERAGLSALRAQCKPEPWAVVDWPTHDCALPRWTRPLLDLATVKYEPMETTYYRNEMTRVLLTEPRVIPHAGTLVPVLEALRPGSEASQLECMADTLRGLSFEARRLDRVLPALLPLVDDLAEMCAPSERASLQERVGALWKRLDRSTAENGSQCAVPSSGRSEAPRVDYEKLGAMLERLAIFPGVQVHLGSDLVGSSDAERPPNSPRSPRRGELIDDAGRRTPELAAALEGMQRSLYDRDGLVISDVRFDKRTDEAFGRSAIEIVAQGACLSTATRIDLAKVSEGMRVRATVDAVTEAVRRELSSSFHRRELLDAGELVHKNVVSEFIHHQADMLTLLREIGAAKEPQIRTLMRHASTLLSAGVLLRELEPSGKRWLQAAAALGSRTDTAAPASVENTVAQALAAMRVGRVADAQRLVRTLRSEAAAAESAIAALYPKDVQRTLLVAAEKTCSTTDADGHVLRSLRSQAQLAAWAVRPELALLRDVAPSRIMRARLCVLQGTTQRQTPYSPSAKERWDLALSAISSMRPEDARRGSLATALDLLRRSESEAPARLPDGVQRALVRLVLDDDSSLHEVVGTLIADPGARWRIDVALELLRAGREFRWVERALAWMVLERSESTADARAVLNALLRLEREAPGEQAARAFLIGRAHLRLDETDRALELFDQARAGAPPWLVEAISDLEAETLLHARRFDDVLQLRVGESESDRCAVWRHQATALIATADPAQEETTLHARRLVEDPGCTAWDPGEQSYDRAWVAVLFGLEDADQIANEVFQKGHPNADYIRLFLTGMRALAKREEHGDGLIQARWQQLREAGAPANWALRARQGDMRVWPEKLIGYWVGAVNERELLVAVESEETIERAGLATLGLTLSSLRAEAYFYIGLRAATEGRIDDAKAMWRRVETYGRPEYHEYVVARFLTRKPEAGATPGLVAMRAH